MSLVIRVALCSFAVLSKTHYENYCQCQKKAITVILVFCLLGCWNSAFLGFSIFSCLRVVVFSEANKILFERDLDLAGRALHFNQKTDSITTTPTKSRLRSTRLSHRIVLKIK